MIRGSAVAAAITISLTSLAAPAAGEPVFSLPVDCTLGDTCYIQQFVDHDPAETFQDFRCQSLTYDGHKGTDFALPSVRSAKSGVKVLAAAPGKVLGFRTGIADNWSGRIDEDAIKGLQCGNGVVIDHGNGWHSQYCHLKNSSVVVAEGDRVQRGSLLGEIGMSGKTEFPHLHFAVRRNGEPVDPFAPEGPACSDDALKKSLWQNEPAYQAGALLAVGFSPAVPSYPSVKAGTVDAKIMRTSPAIVAYSFAFGGRGGDILRQTLSGPGGFFVSDDYVLPKNKAQFFRAIGKKRRSAPWPGGLYVAQSSLIRDGKVISKRRAEYEIPR